MSPSRIPKIVIVEDEGLIAADLESRLKKAGYSVPGTADSAQKALQIIEKTSPDLVLMDIRLKGTEDGIETAALVRDKLDIPVIFLTAYEDNETLQRASRTQAFGYVKKPIATASLKGAIEIALSKHRHERGLREERDWAISSFAAVPHAVLVADSEGRVAYLNPEAEELTGSSAELALGRPMTQVIRLFSDTVETPFENLASTAMLQGQPVPLPDNTYLLSSQERLCPVRGTVSPRWRDGRVEGIVIAITDVTAERYKEEQSLQETKQDALVRMADGVLRHLPDLGDAAEEIARILHGLPANSPLRTTVEKIELAAKDASEATSHLREFMEPEAMNVETILLDEALGRFEEAFQMVEPGFVLVAEPEPLPVRADEWALLRALLNILLHARTRMQPGTGLVMDLSREEREIGPCVCVRINYATVSEDSTALEQIFEPSWSGPSEDLHITHSLVRKMGASISARLDPGNTVRFEICFRRVEVDLGNEPTPELEAVAE